MRKRLLSSIIALAALGTAITFTPVKEPEFPSAIDPITEVTLSYEVPPLAATPKVTIKTTKKKTTTKVKLAKAAKKTYTKKLPTITTNNTNKKVNGKVTTTTDTKIVTATTEKYKKKKTYKNVTKTVTTTITTTVIDASAVAETPVSKAHVVDVAELAPKMDNRVLSAYKTLGFKVTVDESITSFSGYFNAKSQSITLRAANETIYHELGHFLSFVANNYCSSSSFASIYSAEKGLYTAINKAYVTQNTSEYFAESVKDYILSPNTLKASRPRTYEAVEKL